MEHNQISRTLIAWLRENENLTPPPAQPNPPPERRSRSPWLMRLLLILISGGYTGAKWSGLLPTAVAAERQQLQAQLNRLAQNRGNDELLQDLTERYPSGTLVWIRWEDPQRTQRQDWSDYLLDLHTQRHPERIAVERIDRSAPNGQLSIDLSHYRHD